MFCESKIESQWIYAHRGIWNSNMQLQNSKQAVDDAIRNGFSCEIDLQSSSGEIHITHSPIQIAQISNINNFNLNVGNFAFNIKSDGLFNLGQFNTNLNVGSSSFFFDGSIPEMLKYRNLGIKHALRLSEFERNLPWKSDVIWVDGFYEDWWIKNDGNLLNIQDVEYVFVSPEIHGRNPHNTWRWVTQRRHKNKLNYSVCTDFPLELFEHYKIYTN